MTLIVDVGQGREPVKIEVVTFGIDQGQVKLGFNAPRNVNVVRSELMNQKSNRDRA